MKQSTKKQPLDELLERAKIPTFDIAKYDPGNTRRDRFMRFAPERKAPKKRNAR